HTNLCLRGDLRQHDLQPALLVHFRNEFQSFHFTPPSVSRPRRASATLTSGRPMSQPGLSRQPTNRRPYDAPAPSQHRARTAKTHEGRPQGRPSLNRLPGWHSNRELPDPGFEKSGHTYPILVTKPPPVKPVDSWTIGPASRRLGPLR